MSDVYIYVCVRIYANGDAKYAVRDEEGMKSWLNYNKEWRFGNSLFINGDYVENTGYVTETSKDFSKFQQCATAVYHEHKNNAPWKRRNIEATRSDPARFGYPDDRSV